MKLLDVFALLLIISLVAMVSFNSKEINAKPAFAKSTGSPCSACHSKPPKLNDCGVKWKADKNTKC